MEIKGKIVCKKVDNKAFKLGDDWYNMNDNVVASLAKINKGDSVVVTFEKKGLSRYVSNICLESEAVTPSQESTGEFTCAVCGAKLKDGKFKVCYMCNKKGLKAPKKEKTVQSAAPVKNTFNEDRQASIQRGNSLNAAAMVASGAGFNDLETAKQFTLELAEEFLGWLRAE